MGVVGPRGAACGCRSKPRRVCAGAIERALAAIKPSIRALRSLALPEGGTTSARFCSGLFGSGSGIPSGNCLWILCAANFSLFASRALALADATSCSEGVAAETGRANSAGTWSLAGVGSARPPATEFDAVAALFKAPLPTLLEAAWPESGRLFGPDSSRAVTASIPPLALALPRTLLKRAVGAAL